MKAQSMPDWNDVCLFCEKNGCDASTVEFDADVHESCVKNAAQAGSREADMILREWSNPLLVAD